MKAHSPHVTLVGAGPGDPDLLTLKAVKAIAAATVILVDDLVHPDVLQHANPQARIIAVGKRGGCQSTPQAFIEKLMVQAALAGEQVVRLKGGDPLIFGRATEEIDACREAGLPEGCVHYIDNTDRALVGELLQMKQYVDLLVPRGGADLIRFVAEHATVSLVEAESSSSAEPQTEDNAS